jgi:hypothetical protein
VRCDYFSNNNIKSKNVVALAALLIDLNNSTTTKTNNPSNKIVIKNDIILPICPPVTYNEAQLDLVPNLVHNKPNSTHNLIEIYSLNTILLDCLFKHSKKCQWLHGKIVVFCKAFNDWNALWTNIRFKTACSHG